MKTLPNEYIPLLLHAAASGNVSKLRELASDCDVTARDNAALRRAVRHGRTEAVQYLLEAGAPLDNYAEELLRIAAHQGDLKTLTALFSRLSPPHDPEMLNAILAEAVRSKSTACVGLVLESGADVNNGDGDALVAAASYGDTPMIRFLLGHGADPCGRNSQALFSAIFARSPESVRILLAAGVDIHAQRGIPLQLALLNGDAESVEMLLEAGAPITDPEWIAASASEDSLECLLLMLEHDASLAEHADKIVSEAADHAAHRVMKYALNNLTVSQSVVNEALEQATKNPSAENVKALLAHGANPATNNSAAFRLAIVQGHLTIARLLLNAGAEVARLDVTALTRVFDLGEGSLSIELLRRGIDVNETQFTSFSALRFCKEIPAARLFESLDGKPFPKPVRETRLRFAERTAREAFDYDESERAIPTMWLADAIAESRL